MMFIYIRLGLVLFVYCFLFNVSREMNVSRLLWFIFLVRESNIYSKVRVFIFLFYFNIWVFKN